MSVSRLRHIPGIGVNDVGDRADALGDPEMLRLENLDTDLTPPAVAIEVTRRALTDDAANSYLPFEGHHELRVRAMVADRRATAVAGVIDQFGLTHGEVGEIVDASPRSVARWTTGKVVPQKVNKQRLFELTYVAEALAEVLPRDQANVWMFTPNRLLQHRKPAELIRDGQYQQVLAVIDAMSEGLFV